ncbi:MAG: right-handed parallel beta-helix repeat-containing protein, partial [Thermoplasmatales archaeon]|nr:right-handed parallel beta-helix repeat-containing protein [Thermoplasmatales archaeon]
AVIHIQSGANDVAIINNLFNHSANGYLVYIDGADDSVISNNTAEAGSKGIKLSNSNSNSIYDNQIENCTKEPGIKLFSSNNNQIEKNILRNNIYGISIKESSYNVIKNNTIYENDISGIIIHSGNTNTIAKNDIDTNIYYGVHVDDSSHNIINDNNFTTNTVGVYLGASSSDCLITNCTFKNSLSFGLSTASGSVNNMIFNNSFRTNTVGNAKENGNNRWDNGSLGNYWDDFYGPDPENINNTIGDEAYIYTKGGVSDNHPKGVFHQQPSISNPSPANLAEDVDKRPTLSVVVTDPDPFPYTERLDVYFYYILDGQSNLIGVDYNVESGETASVQFASTVKGNNAVYSYIGLGYDYIGVWYVEVEDSYSRSTSPAWIFSTLKTPVDNKKPIIKINAPKENLIENEIHAQANDSIQFDASGCNDTDGEIIFYRWNFGDGAIALNEISPIHSYKSEGTYNLDLVVIDNGGSSNISNIAVKIKSDRNLPPQADANGPYNAAKGQTIRFFSSGSKDPNTGDTLTYNWNLGDGETSTEQHPTHQYSTAGNYTITLTLTDQDGEQDIDSSYALIRPKQTEESPGYEIILVIISILL